MKILHLTYTLLDAEIAYMAAQQAQNDGIKCEIITLDIRYDRFSLKFPAMAEKFLTVGISLKHLQDFGGYKPVKILRELKPDIVITTDDVDPAYHSFLIASEYLNIPTVIVQPGIIGEQPFSWKNIKIVATAVPNIRRILKDYKNIWISLSEMNYSFLNKAHHVSRDLYSRFYYGTSAYGHWGCTKIAVNGESLKDILIRQGIDPKKIVVTGQPRFDAIHWKAESIDSFTQSLEQVRSSKKILLYLPNALFQHNLCSKQAYEDIHCSIITSCQSLPEVQLVIKPHPEEDPQDYMRLITQNGSDALVYEGNGLYDLIRISDAVITGISTTALQSLLLNKVLLVVDIHDSSYIASGHEYVPYTKNNVAIGIHDSSDYLPMIRKALYDQETQKTLEKNRDEFVHYYAYLQDGLATKRFLDLVTQTIKEDQNNSLMS